MIERKPYYGIRIKGSEFSIRLCLSALLYEYDKRWFKQIIPKFQSSDEIREAVLTSLKQCGYTVYEMDIPNMVLQIQIALYRAEKNSFIKDEEIEREELLKENDIRIAQTCGVCLEKMFHINLPIPEIKYLAIQFLGKKKTVVSEKNSFFIDMEINQLVNRMLESVNQIFQLDFRTDFDLNTSLRQHMVSLRIRLQYGLRQDNPLLKEIKEEYTFPYAIAAQASTVLSEHFHTIVPDEEIGYIANPWIDAVASTMKKVLPIILTGSLIFFYNVFRSYLSFLPDLSPISNFSFGLLAIFVTFFVTHEAMLKLGHSEYQNNAALISIAAYLLLCRPQVVDGVFQIANGRIGAAGIMMGIVVGLYVAIVFHLYANLHVLKNNSTLPDFVGEWINNIIPITITLALSMIFANMLQLDLYDILVNLFMPLQKGAQTLPGFILICFVPVIFYSMGISSWVFNAVTTPIFMVAIAENIEAVANGGVAMNIATSEAVFTAALITMGGRGGTLPLNVLMLGSKSNKLKTMGKICIAPSLFNINEPLMFGAPVVFNPLLMLPILINSITGPAIVWLTMHFGLLNIPSKMVQVGQIPAPFSSVMITGDWRAVPVYVVLFIVYLITWYPFYKVYEKQCVEEESKGCA